MAGHSLRAWQKHTPPRRRGDLVVPARRTFRVRNNLIRWLGIHSWHCKNTLRLEGVAIWLSRHDALVVGPQLLPGPPSLLGPQTLPKPRLHSRRCAWVPTHACRAPRHTRTGGAQEVCRLVERQIWTTSSHNHTMICPTRLIVARLKCRLAPGKFANFDLGTHPRSRSP